MKSRSPLLSLALLVALPSSIGVAVGQQATNPNLSYEVINLGTPLGGSLAAVQTISLQGFLAGYANLPDNAQHAILFELSGTKDLGTLGGQNSAILGGLSGFSETATSDPLGQDFCETGTHLVCRAFTLGNRNQVVSLPTLGGTSAAAFGNNALGQVVGISLTSVHDPSCLVGNEPQAPFYQVQQSVPVVWRWGVVKELPTLPGDPDGSANAINNLGQITGSTGDCYANPGAHAVLWQNGQVINLGSLGGAMNNDPEAINDLGEITGDSDLPGDATGHAFLWRKGKMQDLGTLPGDYSSYANSINNLSQIVGQSCDINGNCRPFLWENGNMIDLNTLVPASQANLYYPATIDDLGVIGGIAMNQSTGLDPAFVALPTFGLTGKQVSAGRSEAAPRLSMPQGTRSFVQRRLKHSAAAPIAPNQ